MKNIFYVLLLIFLTSCTSYKAREYQPPLPKECYIFLSYIPINIACYSIICITKEDKVNMYFIDKDTNRTSTNKCFLEKEKSKEDDSEACWYEYEIDDWICIT